MKQPLIPKSAVLVALGALAAALLCVQAQASTNIFNFDSDPSGFLNVTRGGDNSTLSAMAGVWFASGGSPLEPGVGDQSTNGYFAITQTTPSLAAHGMRSVIIFDDFDSGLIVAGFTFSCDLRIGGGSDLPADGFSLNFARANDPVLTGGNFGSGPDGNPANAPEEGTTTGLVIELDAFSNDAADPVGLSLKIDSTIITNVVMPTLNGNCNDPISLQTGPNNAGITNLCWQPLYVNLGIDGKLTVLYKGAVLLTNFQTTFAPSAGRLIFAGRTGGLWEEQDVDNIRIVTYPSGTPVVGPSVANANGFKTTISDSGSATPDTNTITISLDGTPVTPSAIIQSGVIGGGSGLTTVAYQSPNLVLAPGSAHTNVVHCTGSTFAGSVDKTNSFTVPAYALLTAAMKAPGTVNTGLSGFAGRIHQLPIARFPDSASLIGIERQLADGFIDPGTGQPYVSIDPVGAFTNATLNWSLLGPFGSPEEGNFRSTADPPDDYPDQPIPGISPGSPSTVNIAAELLTILDLPVGAYQLGVTHDDGFKLSAGAEPRDAFTAAVLRSDASATDTFPVNFVVTNAGKYPFRLVWAQNAGDAQLEFYMIDFATGTKVLLNIATNVAIGPTNISLIAAYYDTAALTQPYVRWVSPAPGETGVLPDTALTAKLEDGSAGMIIDNSISLQLNGSGTATHSRSGGEDVATLGSAGLLPSGSTNTATLTYSTTAGGPFTYTWQFVASSYQTLPVSVRTPPGSGDPSQPGFRLRAYQISTNYFATANGFVLPIAGDNDLNFWIAAAQGLFGTNAADLSHFGGNGFYNEGNTINYSVTGSAGSITPDAPFPFLPGTEGGTDNAMLEGTTYVEFPAAGFYTMGVQSDDGFEVTVGDSHGNSDLLSVTAPAGIARNYGAYPVLGYNDASLHPRRTGRVIKANPLDMGGANTNLLLNGSAFNGNIVIFHRAGPNNTGGGNNTFRFNECFALGAIGAIDVLETNQLPFGLAPAVTIPCLQLFPPDGDSIIAQCADNPSSPVFASLGGGDQVQVLGFFNGGRGDGTPTLFGMNVPLAGVYPLRLLWYNGGGGLSVEWWAQSDLGQRILINDTATAGSLKGYRARTVTGGRPILAAPRLAGTSLTLSWMGAGELQQAATVNGPYYRTATAYNPQTNAASFNQLFYRVRQY
jgi:hypothetical protein